MDLCSWVNSCQAPIEFNTTSLKIAADDVTSYPGPDTRSILYYGGCMNSWDVSKVESMELLFMQKAKFDVNIAAWDTGKVTDMWGVFYGVALFDQNIASWKTDNVNKMYNMFHGASLFNQNIASWKTDKVTDMIQMLMWLLHLIRILHLGTQTR